MQPNQPPVSPPPSGASQFDFILNNGVNSKGSRGAGGGGSIVKRLLVVAVVGMVIVTIAVIANSILSKGNKSDTETLTKIALQQTELIRVAGLGVTNGTSNSTKNLAATTSLTTESSLVQVSKILKNLGHAPDPKSLTASKNDKTDTTLTTAQQSNQYDPTFNTIILASLTSYRDSVKEAYGLVTKSGDRQTLKAIYGSIDLIVQNQTAKN